MKISGDPMQFAAKPNPGLRAALFYGPNQSLALEAAATLQKTLLPGGDDFSHVTIPADQLKSDAGRLVDEMASFGFFSSKKIILLKDAGDSATRAIQDALDAPDAGHFLIILAEALTPKSSLRALAEKSDKVAAVACYELDGAALNRFVQAQFQKFNASISGDALALLLNRLGGDTQTLSGIIQQLIDYVGGDTSAGATASLHERGAVISVEAVEALLVDQAEQALDDAVRATADRDAASLDRVLHNLNDSGISMVGVCRALQYYFYKLRTAQAAIHAGNSQDEALAKIRPPLFFKTKPVFVKHLRSWNLAAVDRALREFLYLESQCKKTGVPELLLVQQRLIALMSRK